jgi:hypothetical protein
LGRARRTALKSSTPPTGDGVIGSSISERAAIAEKAKSTGKAEPYWQENDLVYHG